MRILRRYQIPISVCCILLVTFFFLDMRHHLIASDHIDAPAITVDGRVDINDTYAFLSPETAGNTVLVMTVNPLAGILSPSTFSSRAAYEFNVDKNGDSIPDFVIVVRFSSLLPTGKQLVSVRYRFAGNEVVAGSGAVGTDIALVGGGKLRAGNFDDPFFFDLLGFRDGFQFTGDDFFAGFNVSGIVIEMPNARLGRDRIGFWGRTRVNGVQMDRVGRPAISTALLADSEAKDLFNQTEPKDDLMNYGDMVREAITGLSGDAAYAQMITMILLPDVLTIDRAQPTNFLNGRTLADDVIDVELNVLSKGGVTTDGVNANDLPFSNTFPYLASPH